MLGPDARSAIDSGLANGEWYRPEIPRKTMKALMKREDGPAIRDTAIYYGAMMLLAGIGIALWPSWWSAPFWLAYGVLYGSGGDSRWHECGHGTAFKTPWMNAVVYNIASFMMMRNAVTWQWGHARHHTETTIVGRDPQIALMAPPAARRLAFNFIGIPDAYAAFSRMLLNASGRLDPQEASFVPETEHRKVIRLARIWLSIYAATAFASLAFNSILPLMVIGLPRIYGAWHHVMTGYLQHGGLRDNVLDHRLNTRTVLMNPISRFIYWNMNYHIEHHLFPMVPYHRLPELHELIKNDLPAPNPSIWHAYREMLPVLKRQLRGEEVFIERKLPANAHPFQEYPEAVPINMPA